MESWLAGGGFVGLLAFSGFLLVRLVHIINNQIARVNFEIEKWKEEKESILLSNARCEKRVSILIEALRASGVSIPSEVWIHTHD